MSINDALNTELEAAVAGVDSARDQARRRPCDTFSSGCARWISDSHAIATAIITELIIAAASCLSAGRQGQRLCYGRSGRGAAGTRWKTLSGLSHLSREMRQVCFRIEGEFERMVGRVDSARCPTSIPRGAGNDTMKAYDAAMAAAQQRDEREWNRHKRPSPEQIRRALMSNALSNAKRER